tara:strand:- start:268 stop:540 length:273 start_codon:yes stop_codon:yes gene_type:complete
MTEEPKQIHYFNMFKDGIASILFIVVGNGLRVKMDLILLKINRPISDSFFTWELFLKVSASLSMWIGILVGLVTLYRFVVEKKKEYKRNK